MTASTAPHDNDISTAKANARARRCYTRDEVCALVAIPRGSFDHYLKTGQLPFCEELLPRIGRSPRYRADLVDQYLANQWGKPRAFRRSA